MLWEVAAGWVGFSLEVLCLDIDRYGRPPPNFRRLFLPEL